MKRIILTPAILLLAGMLFTFGQVTTGTVEYEEVIKFEIKLEGEMKAMMRDMPKERKANQVLYFNEESSLYTKSEITVEQDMTGFSGERRGRGMRMNAPHNIVYTDLEKQEIVEQREFMTRMFLINQEMPKSDWKITGQQKMILDYPCMEATKIDTAGVVTSVWFSPSIPVQGGPALFCNLPGLVLEVNVNDSSHVITAQSVTVEEPNQDILKKPREGKKVTQEEFEQIVKEKMEEMGIEGDMRGPGSGRGMHMIRIHQ